MKFRKNSKHTTKTGKTVKFIREESGIVEYQDGDRTIPMRSELFRDWVSK